MFMPHIGTLGIEAELNGAKVEMKLTKLLWDDKKAVNY